VNSNLRVRVRVSGQNEVKDQEALETRVKMARDFLTGSSKGQSVDSMIAA